MPLPRLSSCKFAVKLPSNLKQDGSMKNVEHPSEDERRKDSRMENSHVLLTDSRDISVIKRQSSSSVTRSNCHTIKKQHAGTRHMTISNEEKTINPDVQVSSSLVRKLVCLIACFPYGVPMEKFGTVYFRHYGEHLNPASYGFKDIVDLFKHMSSKISMTLDEHGYIMLALYESDVERRVAKVNRIPEGIILTFKTILRENKGSILLDHLIPEYEMRTKKTLVVSDLGFSSVFELLSPLRDIFYIRKTGNHYVVCDVDTSNFTSLHQRNKDFDNDEIIFNRVFSSEIKERLKSLLQDTYPGGLSIDEITSAYKGLYGADLDDLDPFKYGYYKLSALFAAYPDVVQLMYCNDQIIVHAPNLTLVDEAVILPSFLKETVSFECTYQSVNRNELFPIGEMTEVVVGDIYSPLKFWLIHQGINTSQALDTLMDRMFEFYNGKIGDRYSVHSQTISIGAPLAVRYEEDKNYYRAFVISIEDLTNVKLFLVDYGTVCRSDISHLRLLHRKFFNLPAQAVKASLDGIQPINDKMMWPKEAAKSLLQLIVNKVLLAQVTQLKDVVYVHLWDISGEENISIAHILMNSGLVLMTSSYPESKPPHANIHLEKYKKEDQKHVELSTAELSTSENLWNTYFPKFVEEHNVSGCEIDLNTNVCREDTGSDLVSRETNFKNFGKTDVGCNLDGHWYINKNSSLDAALGSKQSINTENQILPDSSLERCCQKCEYSSRKLMSRGKKISDSAVQINTPPPSSNVRKVTNIVTSSYLNSTSSTIPGNHANNNPAQSHEAFYNASSKMLLPPMSLECIVPKQNRPAYDIIHSELHPRTDHSNYQYNNQKNCLRNAYTPLLLTPTLETYRLPPALEQLASDVLSHQTSRNFIENNPQALHLTKLAPQIPDVRNIAPKIPNLKNVCPFKPYNQGSVYVSSDLRLFGDHQQVKRKREVYDMPKTVSEVTHCTDYPEVADCRENTHTTSFCRVHRFMDGESKHWVDLVKVTGDCFLHVFNFCDKVCVLSYDISRLLEKYGIANVIPSHFHSLCIRDIPHYSLYIQLLRMGCCVMFDENLELRPSVSAHYLNDVPSILVAAGVCNPNMFRTLEDIIHNYKMENLYGPSYDAHENIPRKAHYSNTSANRSSVVLSESSVASMPIHSVTKETSRHLPMEPSRYSYPASCFQTDFQNNSSNGHMVTSSSLLETSCSPTLWHSTGFMHVPSLNEIYSDNTRNKPGSENSLSGNLTSSLSTPNVKPAYTTSFTTNTVPIQPVNVVKSNRQMLLDSLRQASLQACNTQRLYESSQRSKYRNYGSTQLNPVMTYPHGVQSTTSTNNLVSACNISTSSFVPLTDSTTVSSKSNFQKHYFPLCGYRCGNYLKCSTYHSTNLLQPSAIIAKSSEEHPDVLNVKMPSTQLPNVRDTTVILCTSHHGDVDPQCSKSSSLLSSTSQPANPPKLTRNPRLNQRSSTRPLRRPKTSTAGSAVNLDTLPDTPENTSVSFKPLNDTEINNCKPCISFHYHPSSSCQVPLPNTKLSGSSSMVSSQYNCPPNKLVPYVKSVLNQPNNNSEALSCLAHSHYGLFLSNDSKVPGKKSQEKVNTSSGPNTLDYKMQSSLIMRASSSLRKGILSEEKTKGMEFDVPGNQVPAEMEQLNSNIENMAQISASFLPHNCSNLTGNCIVRQGGHCKVGATTCLESNKFPSFDYRKRDAHMQRVILLSQEICELKCLLQDKKLKFEQFECLSGGSSGCCCSTMQDLQMDILDIKVQYRKKRKVLDDFLSGLQS